MPCSHVVFPVIHPQKEENELQSFQSKDCSTSLVKSYGPQPICSGGSSDIVRAPEPALSWPVRRSNASSSASSLAFPGSSEASCAQGSDAFRLRCVGKAAPPRPGFRLSGGHAGGRAFCHSGVLRGEKFWGLSRVRETRKHFLASATNREGQLERRR